MRHTNKNSKKNIILTTDDKCTGCMACRNICPVDAISSIQNERGFYRPEINYDICLSCGKCMSVCPQICERKIYCEEQHFYAFKHTDEVRLESSSGGVFTWLSDYVLGEGGVVYGCVMDSDLNVFHIGTEETDMRNKMRKSKYVQSDVGLVYREIEKHLYNGQMVLFSGTPCQCEALILYLGDLAESDKLYTLDFICEGGASPAIFKDFIEYYQNKKGITISGVDFRDKCSVSYKPGVVFGRRLVVYYKHDQDEKEQICYNRRINDRFHDCLFLCGLQQKACERCKYHSYDHCTDITCGDFHRYNLDESFKDNLGLSEIIVNTKKAEKLVKSIKDTPYLIECTKKDVWQPLLEHKERVWNRKDEFWNVYKKNGFEAASRLILPYIRKVKVMKLLGKFKQMCKKVIE